MKQFLLGLGVGIIATLVGTIIVCAVAPDEEECPAFEEYDDFYDEEEDDL